MTEQIIISLITIAIPSITTIITSLIARKDNYMHNSKQSILQLIVEDKIRVMEGGIPENKQNILKEFDEYSKKGGNSYVKEKVNNYESWYDKITKNLNKS